VGVHDAIGGIHRTEARLVRPPDEQDSGAAFRRAILQQPRYRSPGRQSAKTFGNNLLVA
jgi:hypothetical protein